MGHTATISFFFNKNKRFEYFEIFNIIPKNKNNRMSPRKRGSHLVKSMKKTFFVYIITDKPYGTLYTGLTTDLSRRMFEHKNGILPGFSKKYSLNRLVYYEGYDRAEDASVRERRMKKWNRDWKIERIHEMNRDWRDLSDELI